jgi:urea transport system ATP-binding protein
LIRNCKKWQVFPSGDKVQPNIIKDIGKVLRQLAKEGLDGKPMAIVLVEQYYDFAAELADQYLVMERGEVIRRGRGADMEVDGVRQLMSI